ncbi:MAG: hypothetical protein LBK42_11485, partial [Propionibacteriaceae bacterium]|nr:hypothetical protein [Propionibacteriaceae bacterium]
FDGARDYARRPTRHLPLVAAAAGLLLAGGAVVSRRLEIAAELHTGLPKAAVLGHLALEAAAWITLALALAAPTVWAAAADLSWDLPGVLRLGLRPLAAGAGGAALGTIAAAAAIQEKQLFTLFKNR